MKGLKTTMKEITFLIVILAITLLSYADNKTVNLDNGVINNYKSNKHIRIPGTKVYMIIPDGFDISKTSTGIENKEESLLIINDIETNYFKSAENFTKVNFIIKGFYVKEFSNFKLNKLDARLVKFKIDDVKDSYNFVFGDSTFTTMIMAVLPSSDDKAEKKIREAMLSVFYEKDFKIDPFETAKFIYDNKVSKYKFSKSATNIYIFSENGVYNPEGSSFSISQIPPVKEYLVDLKLGLKSNLGLIEKYGLTDFKITSEKYQIINGFNSYQLIGNGLYENKKALVHLTLIGSDKVMILTFGLAKDNLKSNLNEFEKITRTIKIK